jgi:heme exporter protein A
MSELEHGTLEAQALHLWRGETHVLRGVSFVVQAGECLQVTGANGAGKTTLLRALCALVPLEAGCIRWRGSDIAEDPGRYHGELAYLGHENGLKGDLTAAENLRYGVGLRRRVSGGQCAEALTRVGLAAQGGVPLRQLSAGQRRRVALARLDLMAAALWILDEPSANLDAEGQTLLLQRLTAHLAQGGAAVVATHQGLDLPAGALRSVSLQ